MDAQKTQIIDRLKQATNILVTVSSNPSVDQLASAIGMTLLLNKLGKHATAVFSGHVPSTIEFLQPEKTLENNTDSLRDFIIALDKSKADKLRYKVEDQMVKIFITPYRTSISDKDLEFSQGDFNVEVVLALGVSEQKDLDQAITAHGRILHDATVIGININEGASLGSINWANPGASSLSEMLLNLGLALKSDVLDSQMATAFLTGIVSETERFSNEKTSSETMQISAKLMSAGANQQLVASQLQPVGPVSSDEPAEVLDDVAVQDPGQDQETITPDPVAISAIQTTELPEPEEALVESVDGSLQIDHGEALPADDTPTSEVPEENQIEQIHIDTTGQLKPLREFEALELESQTKAGQPDTATPPSRLVLEPPSLGGKLTANTESEGLDPSTDPLSYTSSDLPLLSHEVTTGQNAPMTPPQPSVADIIGTNTTPDINPEPILQSPNLQPAPDTLADLENAVDNLPVNQVTELNTPIDTTDSIMNAVPGADVNQARDAVSLAIAGTTPQVLEPVQSLNAQPMDLNLGDMPAVSTSLESAFADSTADAPAVPSVGSVSDFVIPNNSQPTVGLDGQATTLPPQVPPPMIPSTYHSPTDSSTPSPNDVTL